MKKTRQLVMLPTKDGNGSGYKIQYVHEVETLYLFPNDEDNPTDTIDNLGIPQHLYILSDEEIKDHDGSYVIDSKFPNKVLCNSTNGTLYGADYSTAKKIIATTDRSLGTQSKYTKEELGGNEPIKYGGLPQIPQSFIEQYVEAEGKITEVDIIYELINEGYMNSFWRPKLIDNQVIISLIEEKEKMELS